jgi:hypothetical protein
VRLFVSPFPFFPSVELTFLSLDIAVKPLLLVVGKRFERRRVRRVACTKKCTFSTRSRRLSRSSSSSFKVRFFPFLPFTRLRAKHLSLLQPTPPLSSPSSSPSPPPLIPSTSPPPSSCNSPSSPSTRPSFPPSPASGTPSNLTGGSSGKKSSAFGIREMRLGCSSGSRDRGRLRERWRLRGWNDRWWLSGRDGWGSWMRRRRGRGGRV